MPSSNLATVDWDAPTKVPILNAGDITPDVMREYEDDCINFFDAKEIPADKQVRKILAGIKDHRIKDWISVEREALLALSFEDFMSEFRTNYLEEDWESTTRRQLLAMTQGNQSFWTFAVALQAKNSLLINTPSYLQKDKLRHQIEAGIDAKLAKKCDAEKSNKIVDFKKWMADVRRLDDGIRADRLELELAMKNNRDSNRRNNPLTEPPRRTNVTTTSSTVAIPSNTVASSSTTRYAPRLTDLERQLLTDNEGCFKCRKPFADHRSKDCPNNFPNGVGYRTLTQSDVDRASAKRNRSNRPTAAVLPENDNVSAATVHPVAAVLGSSQQPVAYMPSNPSCIIEPDGNDSSMSSTSVSGSTAVAAITVPKADTAPFRVPHLFWKCSVSGPSGSFPLTFDALIDHGSHTVLIREELVNTLGLRRRLLPVPEDVELAMQTSKKKVVVKLTEYVKLQLYDPNCWWSSKTVRAIIAPGLCSPVILGLPFLSHNRIVVDHHARTAIDKTTGFDILNPAPPPPPPTPKKKLKQFFTELQEDRKLLVAELKMVCAERLRDQRRHFETVKPVNIAGAVRERIECLAAEVKLQALGEGLMKEYSDVFAPIPHLDELPTDVYCRIQLKDARQTIKTRSYSCPRKYREAWQVLIQQHLDAGRIRPSNSAHASPAFLVPKADTVVLPRWVNDYRILNSNTVLDSHPLPRVEDILADCAKGKIWSKLDMTNSFFQTRVHPDDIHLTAVTTPFGLYEWLAMPMGLRNSPPIHQRRMASALRELIGKICHIYLDDIIIWSSTVEEHEKHIRLVLAALRKAKLYCNPKKCQFFKLDIEFLGHRISARGIEPQTSKVDKIMNWPVPKSATDVRSFLGLVRYISLFLPNLADHTTVLTPLTTKAAKHAFPEWTPEHQRAFEAIKAIVVSRECLTVIDHENMGQNKVFVTCDASDWRTGATLSYGPTWESARPVAYDSIQLKAAEKNYPVHEKELLAIIRALKKWRSDLLGIPIYVYTDHRTLENFDTQRDLSRRQLRWQEFLSQYDMTITYIRGEDNTVADALSRVAPNAFPDEQPESRLPYSIWSQHPPTVPVGAVLSIATDHSVLEAIRAGYETDEFCLKTRDSVGSVPGVSTSNGLIYVGDRLLVPRAGDLRENLYRLAHDNLGHFGADKSYASLRDAYYWPNMRRDLEAAYIPSCTQCQRNKSATTRPAGPLHPLPIPDKRGDSVAMDFVGPLPPDEGYDCILTMTDRLGADIRIIPTHCNITAKDLAVLFFNHWYCENGLPLNIISDRDKLFISKFWRALTKLTGVKLKMSSSFHPETDGASERSNKTVNQSIRYHVRRNQRGWVAALPRIRFDMMNTINASSGFSGFQLRLGRSPRIIPPIVTDDLDPELKDTPEAIRAEMIISKLNTDVDEAKDNLLRAKVFQSHFANKTRRADFKFAVGDKVMLSTLHRRQEYKSKGDGRVAKFFPRYDGPYIIINAHPETSNYTLELPNSPNIFPTFHSSELKRHVENDAVLFPSREMAEPQPVLTNQGLEEYLVDEIIDSRRRGRGYQYLVRWTGYGPEHDRWMSGSALDECAALDRWLELDGNRPASR
jgi:hypothetical protein